MPRQHTWIPIKVKHKFTGRGVAQNEVSRDVWRSIAHVIPKVRRPVATVGEAPDGGGLGTSL